MATFILCIFLAGIAAYQPNTIGVPGGSPNHWITWLFIFIFCCIAILRILRNRILHLPKLTYAAGTYLLLIVVAALFSLPINLQSLWSLLGFSAGLLFYIALHQFHLDNHGERKLLIGLFLVGGLQAIVGIIQHHQIGFSEPFFAATPSFSGFYQVNVFASFIATTSLCLLGVNHTGQSFKHTALDVLCAAIVVATGYAVFLSGSRVGLIGTLIGFLFISAWYLVSAKKLNKNQLFSPVEWILAWATGYWLVPKLVGVPFDHISNKLAAIGKPLTMVRSDMYLGTWNLFLDSPIYGHGLGSFIQKFQPYYNAAAESLGNSSRLSSVTTHPHNELLFRLAESGIIGALGLMILALAGGILLIKTGQKKGLVYAGLLTPLLLHTQTEFPFYVSGASWVLFLTILYLPSRHFVRQLLVPQMKTRLTSVALTVVTVLGLISLELYLVDKVIVSHRVVKDLGEFEALSSYGFDYEAINYALDDDFFGETANRYWLLSVVPAVIAGGNDDIIEKLLDQIDNSHRAHPTEGYYRVKAALLDAQGKLTEANEVLRIAHNLYPSSTAILLLQSHYIEHPSLYSPAQR